MVRVTAGTGTLSGTGVGEERGQLTSQPEAAQQRQWLLDSRMQGAAQGLEKAKTRPQPVLGRVLAQFLGGGGQDSVPRMGYPCPPCLKSKEGRG